MILYLFHPCKDTSILFGNISFSSPQLLAAIAQLGERQTEDLKVPGSIPGLGTIVVILFIATVMMAEINFIA